MPDRYSPAARAGWAVVLAALIGVGLWHAGEIRWGRFVLAFVAIDLVGYLPGALAYRRARGGAIAPVYHHLYNVTHSLVTAAGVVLAWAALGGGFEWAMLAGPIHLTGDRSVFGNGAKPAGASFEYVAASEVSS